MLSFSDDALVLTLLPHGENGAVVRFLAMSGGLRAGFVPGARGKAKRALLHPGNRVALTLGARAEGQLPGATVELVESRALIAFEPRAAALLVEQCQQQVRRLDEIVVAPDRQRLRVAQGLLEARSELVHPHGGTPRNVGAGGAGNVRNMRSRRRVASGAGPVLTESCRRPHPGLAVTGLALRASSARSAP